MVTFEFVFILVLASILQLGDGGKIFPHDESFISSRSQNPSTRTSPLVGLVSLCMDPRLNGMAILTDTSSDKEVLAVFKIDSFWLVPLDEATNFITRDTPRDQMFIQQLGTRVFPEFPYIPDYVLSFTGLERYKDFYNNVLVFKDNQLFRYRVDRLELDKTETIEASLISKHSTVFWAFFPHQMSDIKFIKIMRGTRILTFEHWIRRYPPLLILNGANLDNPVMREVVGRAYEPYIVPFIDTIKYYYTLKSNKTLTFRATGELCLNHKCNRLNKILECLPQVEAFSRGFAYWIWMKTGMDLKTIMFSLIWLMVANILLALTYLYSQVKYIFDLT